MLGSNSQLCYVGNFTRHLANTNLPVCLSASNSRRDPATCSKLDSPVHWCMIATLFLETYTISYYRAMFVRSYSPMCTCGSELAVLWPMYA